MGDAVQRRVGPAQRFRDRFERLPGQAQLAGAVDARVAGQHLFDQRGARPRQAEDKDGPLCVQSGAGDPCEEVAVERPQQAVHETLVFLGGVVAPAPRQLQHLTVGPAQAVGGAGEVALGVEDVGQAEEEAGAETGGEVRVGQPRLQGGAVGVGQLAAQQRRQPGVGQGIGRLQAQRLAEGGLGAGQVALLLAQPADVEPGHGRTRLQAGGVFVVPARLRQPPFLLERPADGKMRLHRVRVDRQHALPAGDGLDVILALAVQLRQLLPESRVVRRQLDGLFQPGQGVAELAFPLEGQPDVGVGVGQVRVEAQGLQVGGPRLDEPAEVPQGVAEVVVQGGPIGLQAHRLLAVRQGLFRLAQVEQQLAEVRAGRGGKGIQLDGAAEVIEGRVGLAEFAEGDAEVAVDEGEIGPHAQGGTELLDGLAVAAEALQGQAEVAEGFGVVREQPQGRAAAAGRALVLAEGAVSLGEVGVERGDVRLADDGPAHKLDGPAVVALLMMEDAEQVQRVGVFRVAGQHLPIQRGGRTQPSRLMQLDGGR